MTPRPPQTRPFAARRCASLVIFVAVVGCGDNAEDSPWDDAGQGSATATGTGSAGASAGNGSAGEEATAADDGMTDGDGSATAGIIYDLGGGSEGVADSGGSCEAASHTPCDAGTADPLAAMGLGCAGETAITSMVGAHPDGIAILEGFGDNGTYAPTEGDSYVVLSTGHVSQLGDEPTGPGDQIFHCNQWFEPNDGMDTSSFPAPIVAQDVGGDCVADSSLVGSGDCSNTIASQFAQSGSKFDYQEIRVSMTVPANAYALSFDFAYLTTEWPVFSGEPYNDMFIAWLEAPDWTGNISFDDNGNALSLNAAFFDFQDTNGTLPEFGGTCLRYGAGTPWLTSTAPVTPGDEIQLVFAIFDLDDVNLDSLVFLDNFQWQCEGGGGPITEPVG